MYSLFRGVLTRYRLTVFSISNCKSDSSWSFRRLQNSSISTYLSGLLKSSNQCQLGVNCLSPVGKRSHRKRCETIYVDTECSTTIPTRRDISKTASVCRTFHLIKIFEKLWWLQSAAVLLNSRLCSLTCLDLSISFSMSAGEPSTWLDVPWDLGRDPF